MGVRRPRYIAGTARAIGTSETDYADLVGIDLRGMKATVYVEDAGSGGNLTVKFYGEPNPNAAAPTARTGLAQIGASSTVTAGTKLAIEVPGVCAFLVVSLAHATSSVNVTCKLVANPESGAGEW